MPGRLLLHWSDRALLVRIFLQECVRQRQARQSPSIEPTISSWDNKAVLTRSILERHPLWGTQEPFQSNIPGMLTQSEKQYYSYLPKFYQGQGDVVELGPWLGLSTSILIQGLLKNPLFKDRKMFVFDDFVWRASWMGKWLQDEDLDEPPNYGSFLPLFQEQMKEYAEHLSVERQKIADYQGNEELPTLSWSRGRIELLIVDCGRQLHVNEAWYRILSPHFIPDRTMIVMQDWQNFKRVPEVFWENTKIFTDSKGDALDMIHEVDNAGLATFLYRG